MATLYINRPDLELRDAGTAIAVHHNGQRRSTLPTKLIERVIIQHATRLDSNILLKLAEAGAAILLLSPRHSRRVALVLGPAHNEAAIRIAQAHRITDTEQSARIATALVRKKIQRQTRLIDKAIVQRPDKHYPLTQARREIEAITEQLEHGRFDINTLRGYEGAAARSYFQGYAALFAPTLDFTGRNRRPPRDPVNACLSLAYTLLHFDAVRAAHAAGLDPMLGFYHQPAYGRESLACDLIEPLRPVIDEWVWQRFAQRQLREEHFSHDKGACLLGKSGREQFYAAWEKHATSHRRWLRQQCRRLAQDLRQQGSQWLIHDDGLEAGEL